VRYYREYIRELRAETEDLVGEDNQSEVDEGHLFF